jgi:hypothetical protein
MTLHQPGLRQLLAAVGHVIPGQAACWRAAQKWLFRSVGAGRPRCLQGGLRVRRWRRMFAVEQCCLPTHRACLRLDS